MRSVAMALLLLTSIVWWGKEAPAASPIAPGRIGEVFLFADPVRIASADRLQLRGFVRVANRRARAQRSALVVTNGSGVVVFRDERAFMTAGETAIDLGTGFSSSGGPTLPASLPPGDYAARWTLDGRDSNAAHFTVGSGAPEAVYLEPMSSTSACAILHLYNAGPRDLALYKAIIGSTLVVDSQRYARRDRVWMGSGSLRAERGWSTTLSGEEYGVVLHGRHRLAIELGGERSKTVAAECR